VPKIRDAQIEESVRIYVAGLEYDDVRGLNKSAVIIRYFSQIAGNVVAEASVVLLAVICAEVPAIRVKVLTLRIYLQYLSGPSANAGPDFYVAQFGFACSQGTIKYVRLGKYFAVVHPIPRFH